MSDIGAPGEQQDEPPVIPSKEQEAVRPVSDDDSSVVSRVPDDGSDDKSQPGKPVGPKDEDKKPVDPRADRMEQIAERRNEQRTEQLAEIREAVDPEPGTPKVEDKPKDPVEIDPDTMVRTKVRGVEKVVRYGDLVSQAQKVDAADSYLEESRTLLKQAKETVKPAPVVEEKPEPVVDRIAKALDIVQVGGDPAEATAILKEEVAEQAQRAARAVVESRDEQGYIAMVDNDAMKGYAEVNGDPELKHLVAPDTLKYLMNDSAEAQKREITQFLANPETPEPVRQAFAAANITAQGLERYTPEQVYDLYRDMLVKNYGRTPNQTYGLRRPSELTKEAAVALAKRIAAPTPSAQAEPSPTPANGQRTMVNLDRTARKEAIQQPQRATIPRPTPGRQPAPLSQAQRAQAARDELKEARRKGVTPR